MEFRHLAIGMTFLCQTVTGLLANGALLFHYLSLCGTGCKLRPTDLISEHLTLANSLVMLSKGVLQTVQAFGVKYFSQGFRCTLVLFVYRVVRGVSVGTTCLLSVFQTVKISPRDSRWQQLKSKLPKYTGLCIFLSWILHMLVNSIFPVYSISKCGSKNITKIKEFGYCSVTCQDTFMIALYTSLVLLPEVSCSGLMLWSSGSMILILHRHKQQVQHIHRTNRSHRSSPESRATQSVLVLVCSFVSFYTLSSFFHACLGTFKISSWWLLNISDLISTCFPTVSPFVLMSCNTTAARLWIKLSDLMRSMLGAWCCTKVSGVVAADQ